MNKIIVPIKGSKKKMLILRCDCQNEYQDKKYGKGMRACNPTGKNDSGDKYRCTVCGHEIL